ncbi:MAG: hypothetical protein CM15mP23_06720 [Cryomorphaceae bacterium]|nr:MAG: hypothetical protein CM15mP23_06720 [Cryomorphaceae bacterium]
MEKIGLFLVQTQETQKVLRIKLEVKLAMKTSILLICMMLKKKILISMTKSF